MERAAQTFEI